MCKDQAGFIAQEMVHAQELIWHMIVPTEVWCVLDTPQDLLIAKVMLQWGQDLFLHLMNEHLPMRDFL